MLNVWGTHIYWNTAGDESLEQFFSDVIIDVGILEHKCERVVFQQLHLIMPELAARAFYLSNILKSQLTLKFTIYNAYRADFSGFLPPYLAADRCCAGICRNCRHGSIA